MVLYVIHARLASREFLYFIIHLQTVFMTLTASLVSSSDFESPKHEGRLAPQNQIPKEFIDISSLNTMALTSYARELLILQSVEEVYPTFERLKANAQPFIILSNGSNTLLPPVLNASVISPQLKGQHIRKQNADYVWLEVMAGEVWHDLVVATVQQGWYGLENLALIPSWVGASPVQNIGAYGVQVEDVVESVTAFHIPTLTFKTLSNADCQFSYRESIFKREVGQWLITSVLFKLHKTPHINLQYGDVARVAAEFAARRGDGTSITPLDTMQAIIQIRHSKIPDTVALPNCGSFFKNPIVSKAVSDHLLSQFPNLIYYPVKDKQGNATAQVKLAAGWLIDQAGLKGQGIYPILTHIHQALVLANHAPLKASQADVACTMMLIQDTVKQKFGVMLEPEPIWIEADGCIRKHY